MIVQIRVCVRPAAPGRGTSYRRDAWKRVENRASPVVPGQFVLSQQVVEVYGPVVRLEPLELPTAADVDKFLKTREHEGWAMGTWVSGYLERADTTAEEKLALQAAIEKSLAAS